MNKRVGIIIGIVAVLVVVGVVVFTQLRKPVTLPNQQVTQPEEPSAETTKGSIQSLFAQGKDVTCEINYPDQQGSGSIFVSSKKFRGDFITDVEGKSVTSHMIHDGEGTLYVWTDASNQGTKIKYDIKELSSPDPKMSSQAAELTKEVDMRCSSWGVDTSKFTPPSSVQFMDLSTLNLPQNKPGTTPKIDTSACNQISDPQAKAACIKALGGN